MSVVSNIPIGSEGIHSSSHSVHQYSGRNTLVAITAPPRIAVIKGLKEAVSAADALGKSDKGGAKLKSELMQLSVVVNDPDKEVPLYILELLSESICPYILAMKSRYFLSSDRIPQVITIIRALNAGITDGSVHPAHVLLRIDSVVTNIDTTLSSWTRSELSSELRKALTHQWEPMLSPIRSDLQSIASKLLFIGFVELIARPLILAWPIWLVIRETLSLTSTMEGQARTDSNRKNPVVLIFQLLKAIILLTIAFQILNLLSVLNGIGYVCGILGVIILFFQSNDAFLKPFTPLIAEHLESVHVTLAKLHSIENKVLKGIGARGNGTCITTSGNSDGATSEFLLSGGVARISSVGSLGVPSSSSIPDSSTDRAYSMLAKTAASVEPLLNSLLHDSTGVANGLLSGALINPLPSRIIEELPSMSSPVDVSVASNMRHDPVYEKNASNTKVEDIETEEDDETELSFVIIGDDSYMAHGDSSVEVCETGREGDVLRKNSSLRHRIPFSKS